LKLKSSCSRRSKKNQKSRSYLEEEEINWNDVFKANGKSLQTGRKYKCNCVRWLDWLKESGYEINVKSSLDFLQLYEEGAFSDDKKPLSNNSVKQMKASMLFYCRNVLKSQAGGGLGAC